MVVLDLGQYLAGPYGAMILGDLGAEVIKVEPVRGDSMRMAGMAFLGCQRGKLDIAVDVKDPEGLEVVMRLAEIADVVHHNMTKGTAARLGIDYESLKARHHDLVHCNTYAYGAEGPLSDFGGLDPLYQAACGIEYEAGPVGEGNAPLYLRFGMTDTANAMVSVVGVLAALYHQRRTGEGQDLWTSLLNGAAVVRLRRLPGRRASPDRSVPASTATRPGVVPLLPALRDPSRAGSSWRPSVRANGPPLCRIVGRPDLDRHDTVEARIAARAEIEPTPRTRFPRRGPPMPGRPRLAEAGVAAEVSIDTNDGEVALHDADNERLGLVAEYPHPTLGHMRQFGTLVDFSETPTGTLRSGAPGGAAHPPAHATPGLLDGRDRRPVGAGHHLRNHDGLSLGAVADRSAERIGPRYARGERCGGRPGTACPCRRSAPGACRAPAR